MAEPEEESPRTPLSQAHQDESPRNETGKNQEFVDWGSSESLTSDGFLRESENGS